VKLDKALIIIYGLSAILDIVNICLRAAELPQQPVWSLAWATVYWLLAWWMVTLILRTQSRLRLRRSLADGPPFVCAYRGTGEPMVLPMPFPIGLDPLGSPAWLVPDVMLREGDGLMVSRCRRYTAIYVGLEGDRVARVECR
jgi:hypothetical protein